MGDVSRAGEILLQEGPKELFFRSIHFFNEKATDKFWSVYYNLKSGILGSQVVSINGIKVDLDYDIISDSMKHKLRTKHYENAEAELIEKNLNSQVPVVDLGVGIGYTSCVAENHLDDDVPVIGIEANPSMIPVIERTKELNDSQFSIIHSAYHSTDDYINFHVAADFWSSSTYDRENREQKETKVPAKSLKNILDMTEYPDKIQLVADIEGAEHDLINNELDILKEHCEAIIIELHSYVEEDTDYYVSKLTENGYELVESQGSVYYFKQ
ncbi:FkbM family methyltransferase [Halorubrum sp. DTA46]|uniref:FkbM family methyltransferase n=1 Tax=Halorubrum sp. DTA46 TaxID=3402162 RepID=UPI003AB04611